MGKFDLQSTSRQIYPLLCLKHWKPFLFSPDCPKLENAVPHLHTSTVEVSPGAQVQLSCDPGFYLLGEPVLQCQNKGEWSHPLPSCERKAETQIAPWFELEMSHASFFTYLGWFGYIWSHEYISVAMRNSKISCNSNSPEYRKMMKTLYCCQTLVHVNINLSRCFMFTYRNPKWSF